MNRALLLSFACCTLFLAGAAVVQAAGEANSAIYGPRLIVSPVQPDSLKIAIFPVQNLSGMPAPVQEISAELTLVVERTGARLVENSALEAFIERHWIRQLGYIDGQTAQLLKRETNADAVLLSNVEVHSDDGIPRFALISRLVELDDLPRILWMDSAALTGDQNPGLLNMGAITDVRALRSKVLERISSSLQKFIFEPPVRKQLPLASTFLGDQTFTIHDLATRMSSPRSIQEGPLSQDQNKDLKRGARPDIAGKRGKTGLFEGLILPSYNPRRWYSSLHIPADLRYTVAIAPIIDHSTRKNAAELLELHLAKQLVNDGSLNVLELGVIRAKMLAARLIMNEGISAPAIDAIALSLKTDLIVNGKVFDFTETTGVTYTPMVDFTLQMFERDTRRILWSSQSRNRGDDGVYFYDWGRIYTASTLADNMSSALIRKFIGQAAGK